jgi:hypothetical protein
MLMINSWQAFILFLFMGTEVVLFNKGVGCATKERSTSAAEKQTSCYTN